ncbi:MAG: prepilin-type N-terminal cleavage/methylation domain-containing protein [Gemmatimonadetes bacterium]|nr:prepilin-type N-terminal cleavage/methylation domain-containing protein [Gemmatimonadota bacterium]
MSVRRGVSLVEVLVAAVLLAVGVAGALSALVGAARLRAGALLREALADRADARLSWFEGAACSAPDSLIRSDGAPIEERWRLTRDSSGASLAGEARGTLGTRTLRSALVARVECP